MHLEFSLLSSSDRHIAESRKTIEETRKLTSAAQQQIILSRHLLEEAQLRKQNWRSRKRNSRKGK